jgi:hypothetical protein
VNDEGHVLSDILREGATCGSLEDAIASCHKILKERYPQLRFRWCEIHGPRWAHIYGEANELCCDMVRVQLTPELGLCIENASPLPPADVARMVDLLKLCFKK